MTALALTEQNRTELQEQSLSIKVFDLKVLNYEIKSVVRNSP